MIAGRFKWSEDKPAVVRKRSARPSALLTIRFAHGTLTLTEAGTVHRASLYVVDSAEALAAHDPGGLEVLDSDAAAFDAALKQANHTLKRSLTDPHLFSGIGNAYSDEILHAAQLSPFRMSGSLSADESRRLYEATCSTLRSGSTGCVSRPPGTSRERSRHSTTKWPSTVGTGSPARAAARRCSGSSTLRTKPTTAPRARQKDACSRTGPSRDC